MAEMLLINPRKRRAGAKRRKTAARARPAAKRRVRRAKPAYATNPIAGVRRRISRRIKAGAHKIRRRRRNPIGGGLNMKGISAMLKQAAIGGAGAVGMDAVMAQVNKFLPASLQGGNTGMAVKAVLAVVIGKGLSKSTKGMSETAAIGALTVQAAAFMRTLVPASVPLAGVGYAVPAAVSRGTARVSPVMRAGVGMYSKAGTGSPLLGMYTRPGTGSPVLNGSGNARTREVNRR